MGKKQNEGVWDFYRELWEVENVVSQGSILGQLLFCVYVSGLFSMDTRGTILNYAHDTAVFHSADN